MWFSLQAFVQKRNRNNCDSFGSFICFTFWGFFTETENDTLILLVYTVLKIHSSTSKYNYNIGNRYNRFKQFEYSQVKAWRIYKELGPIKEWQLLEGIQTVSMIREFQ